MTGVLQETDRKIIARHQRSSVGWDRGIEKLFRDIAIKRVGSTVEDKAPKFWAAI